MTMATKMQVFHPARVERIDMKRDDGKEYKNPQQLDNAKQYIHWVEHCKEIAVAFKPQAMLAVPPVKWFKAKKTSNVSSRQNAKFVEDGFELQTSRMRRGKTLDLAAAAAKITGQDLADDVHTAMLDSVSPNVLVVRDTLLVSRHWDRTHTTATEKDAAAAHFPFRWLVSLRATYISDSAIKKKQCGSGFLRLN